jgi:hypothetical protein
LRVRHERKKCRCDCRCNSQFLHRGSPGCAQGGKAPQECGSRKVAPRQPPFRFKAIDSR